MQQLISYKVLCPYCGESFEALIDDSQGDCQYTEDCYVCCRPIVFSCHMSDSDEVVVATYREDDAF